MNHRYALKCYGTPLYAFASTYNTAFRSYKLNAYYYASLEPCYNYLFGAGLTNPDRCRATRPTGPALDWPTRKTGWHVLQPRSPNRKQRGKSQRKRSPCLRRRSPYLWNPMTVNPSNLNDYWSQNFFCPSNLLFIVSSCSVGVLHFFLYS